MTEQTCKPTNKYFTAVSQPTLPTNVSRNYILSKIPGKNGKEYTMMNDNRIELLDSWLVWSGIQSSGSRRDLNLWGRDELNTIRIQCDIWFFTAGCNRDNEKGTEFVMKIAPHFQRQRPTRGFLAENLNTNPIPTSKIFGKQYPLGGRLHSAKKVAETSVPKSKG